MRRDLSQALTRALARELVFSTGISGTAFNTLTDATSTASGVHTYGTGAATLDSLTSTGWGTHTDAALEFDYTHGVMDPRMTVTRAGTATVVNAAGLIETVAANTIRITYDPVTLARLGYLNEETRVNLALWSEAFDNAAWTKSGATVTANAATAPDGTTGADKLAEIAGTSVHQIDQTISVTSGTAYTFTIYAKAAERSWLRMAAVSAYFGASNSTWFNLANGTVGTNQGATTASITPAGNGWYRCTYTRTATATNAASNFYINVSDADGGSSYNGVLGSGAYLWGFQAEAGGWATTYIPTTSATVTRNVDLVAVNSLGAWFNPAEGTMFVDFTPQALGTLQTYVYFDDTTANERMGIRSSAATNAMLMVDGGVVQVNSSLGTVAANTACKAAMAWKLNDAAGTQNGAAIATDTGCTIPTVTRMLIGFRLTNSEPANAIYRKVKVYATRRTNPEIVAMTA
jgi:hypothetical protein